MDAKQETERMLAGLGGRIRAARDRKKLTQEQLSAQAELSPITLSKIERSIGVPSLDIVLRIASVLGESPNDLFGWMPVGPSDEGRKRAMLIDELASATESYSDEYLAALTRLLRTKI